MGRKISRTQIELSDEEVTEISRRYHAWRGQPEAGDYADVLGLSKSATISDIESTAFVLAPGRYVGTAEVAADENGRDISALRVDVIADMQRTSALAAEVRNALEAVGE